MKNVSMEIFDIASDYVNYLLVAQECSSLAKPYTIFLGLASVSSMWSIYVNLKQARGLTMNGIETTLDDLHKNAAKYVEAHPEEKEVASLVTMTSGFWHLWMSDETRSKALNALNRHTNTIHPLGGSEEDLRESSAPFWLKTFKLRHSTEVLLIEARLQRERIVCALFIVVLEDIPFLLMNCDMIAKSEFFGCSVELKTSRLFVLLTFVSTLVLGAKMQKAKGIFGRNGISQKLMDYELKVQMLSIKGEKEWESWHRSGVDLEATAHVNSDGKTVASFARARTFARIVLPSQDDEDEEGEGEGGKYWKDKFEAERDMANALMKQLEDTKLRKIEEEREEYKLITVRE
jgi:hypothetical protein